MAIHFITGKPGGGKTLYAMQLIILELLYGTRHIFTNVPFRLDELNAYVQTLTEKDCRVVERMHRLSDEEAGKFFCIRHSGEIKFIAKDDWHEGRVGWKFPDYSSARGDGGILYVIDEVQNYFGARRWASTGPHVLYYQSQHRKLSDTVVLVTQAAMLVETQFRAISEDFCEIKNWSKIRISYLTLPRVFLRQIRATAQPNALVLETKFKRLDLKMANCYDTAAGVGIHGAGADKGEKAKGVPWWAAVLAVGLSVWFGSKFVARLFVNHFVYRPPSSQVLNTNSVPAPAPAPAPPVVVTQNVRPLGSNSVHVTGYMKLGNELHVTFSDGSVRKYFCTPEMLGFVRGSM